MRVAIIPPSTRSGESTYSTCLINGLRRRGIAVDLIQHFALNKPNLKVFLGSLVLPKLIDKGDISILHNVDNLGPFLIKRKNVNVEFVLTVHDITPILLPNIHNTIVKFDWKILLPRLIGNSDAVIAVSVSTKNDLVSVLKIEKSKIEVIPEGVDTTIFYPRTASEMVLRKYNISQPYVLYVGTDHPRKNLRSLILGYSKIYSDIVQDLVLVGPIDHSRIRRIIDSCNNLESQKKELLNRVKVVGYVDEKDLPVIYSAASAFVFPPLYEGFGLPPLEAMACGLPVVVSDNSSLREVVGGAGLYINDPLSQEQIAEVILKILEDDKLQKKLTQKGIEQARQFSWDRTVEKTIEVYSRFS